MAKEGRKCCCRLGNLLEIKFVPNVSSSDTVLIGDVFKFTTGAVAFKARQTNYLEKKIP
jgi:hypothetical protein